MSEETIKKREPKGSCIMRQEKQNKVKHCYLCGEELQDLRQFVHYECVVKAVLSGNVTDKIRKYIKNHGLTMKEIKEEYKGV